MSYLKKISGPASSPLADAAALAALREKEEALVVGVFPSGLSGPEYEAYLALA